MSEQADIFDSIRLDEKRGWFLYLFLEYDPDVPVLVITKINIFNQDPTKRKKCARRDLNSHVLRHWNLNPARLPIPPRARALVSYMHDPHYIQILRLSCQQGVFFKTVSMKKEQPRRLRVKAWHVIFLAVLICATLGLAWWQWTRFQSGSGTFQNLGYALQWPFFGLFFVYAYRKFLAYENEKRTFEAEQGEEYISPEVVDSTPELIDETFLPERRSLTIEEFNALNKPKRNRHN